MSRRGPDGSGSWTSADGRVLLGHRRLAIIDLSESAAQPMSSADGRLHIVFNGEIYNYKALRDELLSKGYCFSTTSDTEVLLQLYADRGENLVHALQGMFSLAIWDSQTHTLFAARDPFGIKPLYFCDDGRTLRFASQVKALAAGGGCDLRPEPAGHIGFFVLGSVPEPYTLYRGIRSLPPGSTLTAQTNATPQIRTYFEISNELALARDGAASTDWTPQALREALKESVGRHLVADVRVGVFLSSGIDSTTIAALACESRSAPLQSITLGFEEYRGTPSDEVPLAQRTAEQLGMIHTTKWIKRNEFEEDLDQLLEAMDQPSIDGVNTYFVSKAAASIGLKVALSGLGGDELFGGYPSFSDVPQISRYMRPFGKAPWLGAAMRRIVAPLTKSFASPKYASLLEFGPSMEGAYFLRRALFMPWELRKFLDPAFVEEGWGELALLERLRRSLDGLRTDRERVASLELSWYMRNQLLRDADWAGMAHSLEIRVPLVDATLFRKLAPLMGGPRPPTKADIGSTPERRLEAAILTRRKTGFSIPVQEWAAGGARRTAGHGRLRAWALRVHPPQRRFRALALVTDAFGGTGGIAKFNRDFLTALSNIAQCDEVVGIPRLIKAPVGTLPAKLQFRTRGAAGKLAYAISILGAVAARRFDLVVAGHINLLPLAIFASKLMGCPCVLVIHGVDAWTRHRSPWVRLSLRSVSSVVAVSHVTLERFAAWAPVGNATKYVLPNCVDLNRYTPGPKSASLIQRLGLENKTVIMTIGRLASFERYKGFDEILEAMPELRRMRPDIAYMICGDGDDRARIERRAHALGLDDCVVFTGYVPESEKVDYFRLADGYAMPSQGEGFGIVFLEAMACGIPVLGSKLDGSSEALLGGRLGLLVDPRDMKEVVAGVDHLLEQPRAVPEGLDYFSRENFDRRVAGIIRHAIHR